MKRKIPLSISTTGFFEMGQIACYCGFESLKSPLALR